MYIHIYLYRTIIYTHKYILIYVMQRNKNVHISYKIVTKTEKFCYCVAV